MLGQRVRGTGRDGGHHVRRRRDELTIEPHGALHARGAVDLGDLVLHQRLEHVAIGEDAVLPVVAHSAVGQEEGARGRQPAGGPSNGGAGGCAVRCAPGSFLPPAARGSARRARATRRRAGPPRRRPARALEQASAPRSAASSRFSVSSRISCVDSTRSMSLTRRENPDDTRRARDPTPPSRCSASWPTERSSTCSAAAAFCVEPAAGRSIAASPRLAARSSGQRVAASARGDRPASKLGASSRAPCSMRRVASSLKSRTASESRLSCGPGQKTSTGTGEPEATSSARAPSGARAAVNSGRRPPAPAPAPRSRHRRR